MAVLTINDNPSISDTIVFDLAMPDAKGCFVSNPYKVNRLVIYYVERDFTSGKTSQYEDRTYDLDKLKAAEVAEATACADPTEENILAAKAARSEADSSMSATPFYFNEAKPVFVLGNDGYPAWLSTDLDNAFLELVEEDENGDPVYGQFKYTWQPHGMREGDYFMCWTWTPLPAGDSLSAHLRFSLAGDTQVTTSLPTHFTNPAKYTTLLERYTPEMFKMKISDTDRTPEVLDKFNKSVALGFNTLEDLGNQIVDLQDGNSIHEALLPYLSNYFGLKLKTNDPTRWRGQIKRAIPLYKMKGTKKGLSEALEHAAMKMLELIQLWEVTSSYTWQEVFLADGTTTEFELEKVALTVDQDNFELWLRPAGEDEWIQLSSDYVDFVTSEGITTMIWLGSTLSVEAIDLIDGDEIRVLYKYAAIPDNTAQTIENYVRTLPLMDQRDEREQDYPLKNWNVRLIAPNDPMFDLVIPNRHPYHDPLIFGKVRTEFPYSENIYNMEEYNGSIRNSKNPCDIDRDFKDPCTACISSNYNLSLEIENLSDDRILEAKEVLREYTPFHAVLFNFGFLGGINEFVESPQEEIEALVSIHRNEFVVSGDAQRWFNRLIKLVETNGITRSQLATSALVESGSGTAYNDDVVLFCPDAQLDRLGIAKDGSATLEILSPSPLSGEYAVENPDGHSIELVASTGVEPIDDCPLFAVDGTLNTCAFTFDIANAVPAMDATLCDIEQDNIFVLRDSNQDFTLLNVRSTVDGNAWSVLIPAYDTNPYVIADILPDGGLVLTDNGTLPSSSATDVIYEIQNDASETILNADEGTLTVTKRGRVKALSAGAQPVENLLNLVNFYQEIGGTEYQVIGFVDGTDDEYYINGYDQGDAAGVNLEMKQKPIKGAIGYLSHRGLKLQMAGDLEDSLGIQNGANSLTASPGVTDGIENDGFKENFIVFVEDDAYFISEIDGSSPPGSTTFTLSGPGRYWKTLGEGGTSVSVAIYQYTKESVTIPGQQFNLPEHTFRSIDRSGRPVITGNVENTVGEGNVISLSLPAGNMVSEYVQQNEGVNFSIEYADGATEQGEI